MFARHWIARLVLALVALPLCLWSAPRPHRRRRWRPPLTTVMYIVNQPDSIASFAAHADEVSIAAPQSFVLDAAGFVGGNIPDQVLAVARAHHVALMPLVVNRGFSQPLMRTLLDSRASRARAIRYLLYLAQRDGDIGFQFDLEHIYYTYRRQYTEFFREAAIAFHRHHLILSAAVVGRLPGESAGSAPQGGYANWGGVYNYRGIARWANFISLMAYPQHGGFSGPGAVAGYDWVNRLLAYARARIPAGKLSLGVPIYGVEWTPRARPRAEAAGYGDGSTPPGPAPVGWSVHGVSFSDVATLLANPDPQAGAITRRWDALSRSHYLVVPGPNGPGQVWYADAAGLQQELVLLRRYRLTSLSAWRLGSEDPAIWPLLRRDFRIRHPRPPRLRGTFDQRSEWAAR
ncbi:MAG: glycosyl hydrolase family 18 protein [Terriglobales bacterium]